ncbi:MAG: hypothetical protein WC955_10160 [Elusimicrobiota bacterium]
MKRILGLVLSAAILFTALGIVTAANWGDSFTVTLTPTGDRGVIIDTTTVAMGDLVLGTTNSTTSPIPVISTGTLAPIEYTMNGSIAGGWALSADGSASAQNELAVFALFNAAAPATGDFASSTSRNLLVTSAQQVADGAPGKYEGDEDLDSMSLNALRHLWLKLITPPTASIIATQTVTITITAEAAD